MEYLERIVQHDFLVDVLTNERPSDSAMGALMARRDDDMEGAHPHTPGDGFHALPEPPAALLYNGRWMWRIEYSGEAALAEAAQLCALRGIDYDRMVAEVFSGELNPGRGNDKWLTRPIGRMDIPLVFRDLVECGYHRLYRRLVRELAAAYGPVPEDAEMLRAAVGLLVDYGAPDDGWTPLVRSGHAA